MKVLVRLNKHIDIAQHTAACVAGMMWGHGATACFAAQFRKGSYLWL